VLAAPDERELAAVGEECRALGASALVVPLDSTDADAVEALARRAVAAYGRVDAWVHLAAIATFAPFGTEPIADFQRVIDVNVMGYVHGARAALDVFRTQGSGVLVNVGSILSEVPAPALSAYVTSKFAVLGLGKVLRADLRRDRHIHVCTIMPGAMDTPLWRSDAKYVGTAPTAPAPRYSVERVARVVVRRSDHPRPEVAVGATVKALRVVHRLFPRVTEWALVRHLARVMYGDRG
jgi:NAD(P)-dependent dehydrogenase (short-subunit alcohol dehydrogenase family)